MMMPNYDYPSTSAYLRLVNFEAFLVQIAEMHKVNGFLDERRCVLVERRNMMIARKCMKAALKKKEKATRVATQVAAAL